MDERDVLMPDGRTLHVYEVAGVASPDQVPLLWCHGTPNVGAPPEPLFAGAERLGFRWIGYDRPGYGGSTVVPGRTVGSAAADVESLADALELDTFALMGHSSGGSHALAVAAALPDRVSGVVSIAGPAPYDAQGLDWFAGMGAVGRAGLEAAARGREAKEQFEAAAEAMPDFTPSDWAALKGEWSWLMQVVGPALSDGPGPLIDDDHALVTPWGVEPDAITAPALLVHGADDEIVPSTHSSWLAGQIGPTRAELRVMSGHGHVSVLTQAEAALEWLASAVRR